jgi:hypothetical protein
MNEQEREPSNDELDDEMEPAPPPDEGTLPTPPPDEGTPPLPDPVPDDPDGSFTI